ncbi:MAG: amidohydrolase family protein [Planctomycetota bacterium]|nr:amidohydrolase family protein [Planctomycetota bacterium]
MMNNRKSWFVASVVVTITVNATARQSSEIPAPKQQTQMVLRHVDVRPCTPGAKPIPNGWVVFDKGCIVALGAEPIGLGVASANAMEIDAPGHVLTPGLWASATTLGLIETAQVEATDDTSEFGDFHPEIKASTATNPDSDLPPVARNAGILMAHVFPVSGVVGGHASAMRLDGWTIMDRTVNAEAGMIVHWPMMEPVQSRWQSKSFDEQRKDRDKAIAAIDRFFDAAEAYLRARAADPGGAKDARYESLRGVIEKREPVLLDANWPGQIEASVLWAIRRGYRPVVVGGLGAPEMIPLLKANGVPVIVRGINRMPLRESDGVSAVFEVPAKLANAGLNFSIASGDEPAHERSLPSQCGRAVGHGLDVNQALECVTRVPAELAGVGAHYGTVAPGMSATLVLWSGDPFEITTVVRRAWVDGREVDLNDRQTRMHNKYLEKELQRAPADPVIDAPVPVFPASVTKDPHP